MQYVPATQLGWLHNHFGTDAGAVWHAVSENSSRAICGAPPGRRGDGWFYQALNQQAITCPKCKDLIARRRQLDARRAHA